MRAPRDFRARELAGRESILREDGTLAAVRPEDRMEDAKMYFEEIGVVPELADVGPGKRVTFFPMDT